MSTTESSESPDEEVLYKLKRVMVTPSWLIIKNTSYAVRYMQKLKYIEHRPPRIASGIIFVLFLLLTIWQVLRIRAQPESETLGWILLSLCLLVLLVSSFVTFAMSTRYTVVVVLATEGKPISLQPPTKIEAKKLHSALAGAMNFYRGSPEISSVSQDKAKETG